MDTDKKSKIYRDFLKCSVYERITPRKVKYEPEKIPRVKVNYAADAV